MTDTDGPTLRDLLLERSLEGGSVAKFNPLFDALKKSGALDSFAGMTKQMSTAVALAAKVNAAQSGAHSGIAKAAAAALLPMQRTQSAALNQLLADNGVFRAHQRMMVLSLLPKDSTSGLFAASAAIRAGALAALEARAAETVDDAPADPVAKAYGSHQLTFEQTMGLTSLIWTVIQAHLQDGSNKHLLETHMLTLCLMTLIWCALAAAP